ncbi:MAG: GTPase HflX [Gammaproteobacteria bacterium]|nr:GTPase HflX [Gammaproteobacteria bacterium]
MFFERPDAGRKAILLQVHFKGPPKKDTPSSANARSEALELARTAEIEVCRVVSASRQAPHPKWFVGPGKVEEIAADLAETGADLLIVNHDLGASQQRDLEGELKCRVITRTELILQIFAGRARSYEGHLQVELAQLKHAQTRLVRGWTHLDRQKGGIGLRGAGETQIEMDQRMLKHRIKRVQSKLVQVARRRDQNRRRRRRAQTRTVSLVGYTNAGKSTLFNALTGADVATEDKLFATLDPTMRRLSVPGAGELVLSDTVGFINHLPHDLVDAFKATLEEVSNADLLLHVVDASCVDWAEDVAQVNEVLAEIGALELPTITVLNKIDLLDPRLPVDDVESHGRVSGLPGDNTDQSVYVSALTGVGLERLIAIIGKRLGVEPEPAEVFLAAEDGETRAWLYSMGAVIHEEFTEDGRVALKVRTNARVLERLGRTPRVLLQVNEPMPRIAPLPN